jgi:hypothetical protein
LYQGTHSINFCIQEKRKILNLKPTYRPFVFFVYLLASSFMLPTAHELYTNLQIWEHESADRAIEATHSDSAHYDEACANHWHHHDCALCHFLHLGIAAKGYEQNIGAVQVAELGTDITSLLISPRLFSSSGRSPPFSVV